MVSISCHKNFLAIAELVSWRPEKDHHETQETATDVVQRSADRGSAGRLRVAGRCADGNDGATSTHFNPARTDTCPAYA